MAQARVRKPSFCRMCHVGCPIWVDVEGGRAVSVTGIDEAPMYEGYTCVKGRTLPEQLYHPERLLHSLKRMPDGSYEPISSDQLMDEIAERLQAIVERHGPAAVAAYSGTKAVASALTRPFAEAFLNALGSPMRFDPDTIDQAGKHVAKALQGAWMAPSRAFQDPDVGLIVGANPLVSYGSGLPTGHPGKWIQRWAAKGHQLIVVDPRRSDIAKRATIHLQPRPGEDVSIVAGILRVILTEELYDASFVEEDVSGVDELRRAVEPFTPEYAARRADIDADELVRAARIFAGGTRGVAVGGTGPNMSGHGTLIEYLLLNIDALCGRYMRAGEQLPAPFTLTPPMPAMAAAIPPMQGYGLSDPVPGSDLTACIGGMPTAALPAAILHDGDDRIRALISCGGNPVAAWPDQLRTIKAMESLELLVQVDITMSATAYYADYVVAPKMSLEVPALTVYQELFSLYGVGCSGYTVPWAQHSEAVVDPPAGSDVIEEWELYYGLAQRMGLQLTQGALVPFTPAPPVQIDMVDKPASDDLLAIFCDGGRIPLEEVKRHPAGAVFPDPPLFVQPKEPGWEYRLDVANAQMMADLADVAAEPLDQPDGEFTFRLISRRMQQAYNSSGHRLSSMHGRTYNPAFMHPADLEQLGVTSGDTVELRSTRAAVVAVVEADDTLRRGLVSMSHAFGGPPERDHEVRSIGTNTSRLITGDRENEPYVGQPRMSNVPIAVRPSGAQR